MEYASLYPKIPMNTYMVKGSPNISAKKATVKARYTLLGSRATFLRHWMVAMNIPKKITLAATSIHWFQPKEVRVR
jgi:hypothetical protein